jgi:hypothetical protein
MVSANKYKQRQTGISAINITHVNQSKTAPGSHAQRGNQRNKIAPVPAAERGNQKKTNMSPSNAADAIEQTITTLVPTLRVGTPS